MIRRLLCTSIVLAVAATAAPAAASPYPLESVIKKEAAERLAAQGVKTTSELLDKGARAKGRAALSKAAKVSIMQLTLWVQMCDLLRIEGVGPEMVRLLNAGRVLTVVQLKRQKAAQLHPKLLKANDKAKVKITENPPDLKQVEAWIAQAAKLAVVLR